MHFPTSMSSSVCSHPPAKGPRPCLQKIRFEKLHKERMRCNHSNNLLTSVKKMSSEKSTQLTPCCLFLSLKDCSRDPSAHIPAEIYDELITFQRQQHILKRKLGVSSHHSLQLCNRIFFQVETRRTFYFHLYGEKFDISLILDFQMSELVL